MMEMGAGFFRGGGRRGGWWWGGRGRWRVWGGEGRWRWGGMGGGGFSEGFREYPFNGGVIYNAPIQLGPANLLFAKASGYRATMVGIPYDDVKGWAGPYPAEILAGQYEKVAGG